MGKRPGLLKAKRGAVLAEFAIAFMPICAMFLGLTQLSRYAICRLAVMHAAEVSVRACAVIIEPDPGHDANLDGPDTDVQTAAHMVMKPFGGDLGGHEIHISDPTCEHTGVEANGGTDTVTLQATYTCTIPLGKLIVCGLAVTPKTFTIQAQFPHQGAEYQL
jgi:hypothetical protein